MRRSRNRAACGRRIGMWIYVRPRRRTYLFTSMSVLLIVGPKCTLPRRVLPPGEPLWVCRLDRQTDRQTDVARPLQRYIMLSPCDGLASPQSRDDTGLSAAGGRTSGRRWPLWAVMQNVDTERMERSLFCNLNINIEIKKKRRIFYNNKYRHTPRSGHRKKRAIVNPKLVVFELHCSISKFTTAAIFA